MVLRSKREDGFPGYFLEKHLSVSELPSLLVMLRTHAHGSIADILKGGSDLANLKTTARKTEDGKFYIVNGHKVCYLGGLQPHNCLHSCILHHEVILMADPCVEMDFWRTYSNAHDNCSKNWE